MAARRHLLDALPTVADPLAVPPSYNNIIRGFAPLRHCSSQVSCFAISVLPLLRRSSEVLALGQGEIPMRRCPRCQRRRPRVPLPSWRRWHDPCWTSTLSTRGNPRSGLPDRAAAASERRSPLVCATWAARGGSDVAAGVWRRMAPEPIRRGPPGRIVHLRQLLLDVSVRQF